MLGTLLGLLAILAALLILWLCRRRRRRHETRAALWNFRPHGGRRAMLGRWTVGRRQGASERLLPTRTFVDDAFDEKYETENLGEWYEKQAPPPQEIVRSDARRLDMLAREDESLVNLHARKASFATLAQDDSWHSRQDSESTAPHRHGPRPPALPSRAASTYDDPFADPATTAPAEDPLDTYAEIVARVEGTRVPSDGSSSIGHIHMARRVSMQQATPVERRASILQRFTSSASSFFRSSTPPTHNERGFLDPTPPPALPRYDESNLSLASNTTALLERYSCMDIIQRDDDPPAPASAPPSPTKLRPEELPRGPRPAPMRYNPLAPRRPVKEIAASINRRGLDRRHSVHVESAESQAGAQVGAGRLPSRTMYKARPRSGLWVANE